jgi:hypothetical protein
MERQAYVDDELRLHLTQEAGLVSVAVLEYLFPPFRDVEVTQLPSNIS